MKHRVTAALFALLIFTAPAYAWTVEQPTSGLVYKTNGQKKLTLVFRPPLRVGQQVYRLHMPGRPNIWHRLFGQGSRYGLVPVPTGAPVPKGGH